MKLSTLVLIIWISPFAVLLTVSFLADLDNYRQRQAALKGKPRQPKNYKKRFTKSLGGIDWGYVAYVAFVLGWFFGLLGLAAYLKNRGL